MAESFDETFDCGWCESENVFTVSSAEFTQVDDLSGFHGWMPVFDKVKRVCPHCDKETEFTMDVETARGKDWLFIYEVEDTEELA